MKLSTQTNVHGVAKVTIAPVKVLRGNSYGTCYTQYIIVEDAEGGQMSTCLFAGTPSVLLPEFNPNLKTVSTNFNGIEEELESLRKHSIKVVGLDIGGGGNTEATLQGEEKMIRIYFAKLWNMLEDSDEINELFES